MKHLSLALICFLSIVVFTNSQDAAQQHASPVEATAPVTEGQFSNSAQAYDSSNNLEISDEFPVRQDAGMESPDSGDVTTDQNAVDVDGGDDTSEKSTAEAYGTKEEASLQHHSPSSDHLESTSAKSSNMTANANEDGSVSDDLTKNAQQVQAGPFIDLLGPHLLSLEMLDATHAQLVSHYTNEALKGKTVVGLYFSADWCGPCRKFTPELTAFYNKMNERRGKKDEFEIVWISRCRDVNSFGQYFTQMGKWMALPPEEAMGERGRILGDKYKVKSIPSLVLLDDLGNVITRDGRNKIPADKAGIGFPWRNPIANVYVTLIPRSVRLMLNSQVLLMKDKMLQRVKRILGLQRNV